MLARLIIDSSYRKVNLVHGDGKGEEGRRRVKERGIGWGRGGIAMGYVRILYPFYREVLFAFPKLTLRYFGVYIQIRVESIAIASFD